MQEILSKMSNGIVKKTVSIGFLLFGLTMFTHALAMNLDPTGAVSSVNVPAPPRVKILAQIPLRGLSPTRMYTQWEYGRTYLYIEQGDKQLTSIDITRKQILRVVDHHPEQPIAPQLESADGGSIEMFRQPGVRAGVDNVRDRGKLSILQPDDPRDAQLLRFFGYNASNLADRDRRLIFFASPTRLLIVEDERWYGVDYTVN